MSPQFTVKLYNHLLVLLLLCVWLTYFFSCHAISEIDTNNKAIECVESERDALLEFKRGILVDRCGFLASWGVTHDCCQWHGIQCHNHSGQVIALRLPTPQNYYDNNDEPCLEGTLDASLLDLKHLNCLDLSFNYFHGQMPKFIGSLSNLEHLKLSNVGLTGVIPQEIGNLSKLTSLDFNCDYNSMRVESLRWLSQLTLLRELDLGGIDLSLTTNNWLSIINNLPQLHALRFDYSNLSLKLPSSLSYINSSSTLGIISLVSNNLDSSIFQWLSSLSGLETSLVYLDLSWNSQLFRSNFQLSRHNWNFLGNLSSLQTLQLYNTSMKYEFSDIIQSLSACSHKSRMHLDLSDNQLWGSLPDNIGNLSYLRELHVARNQLNDTISQAALGRLPMLETLDLSSNSLKEVFTSNHLSNLSKLRNLDLSDNTDVVVNISANWVPPFQLQKLGLSSCKVGPDFPMWLLTQKNLTSIGISNAGISSMIPDSFFNLFSFKLRTVSMSQNKMYGIIPDVSITFAAPSWIDLSSNDFSGAIPPFMRQASLLILKNNKFSQGLVPLLCPQTKMPLKYLDVSNNSLSDKLPDCWGYFDKLVVLHLENNNLRGNIPISIGALNQLKALHLSNNNLSGEIPASLVHYCTSLTILDLSRNSLTGYIPAALGNMLKYLSILILRDNKFFGILPSSLCHLSRLQMLDFSNNRISGTIPRCIDNLKGMVSKESLLQTITFSFSPYGWVAIHDNALIIWKGNEQNIKEDVIGYLKTIDLSNNMLKGKLPEEISNLVGLEQINLSRNHLCGAITSRIGQLTSLESLDLSHNKLSGEIPTSLATISYLGVLNLSYNNLSGKIPDGTQLQSLILHHTWETPDFAEHHSLNVMEMNSP